MKIIRLEMEMIDGFNFSCEVRNMKWVFKITIHPFNAFISNAFAILASFQNMIFVKEFLNATVFVNPNWPLIF